MPAWPTLKKDERAALIDIFDQEYESPEELAKVVWQTVGQCLRARDGWVAVLDFSGIQVAHGPFWREADARKAAGEWAGAMGKGVVARVGKLSAPAALDLKREDWDTQ